MKSQKLSEQAYIQIKQFIKERRYFPGDPLPENELSAILHMSRTPIREALHRLETEQIIIIKPRLGAFVATVDFSQLCELYETREVVEGMIARILCKPHIDTTLICQLKNELLDNMKILDRTERLEKLHKYGSHYTSVLRSLCENEMLKKISSTITARIENMGQVTHVIPLFPEASVPERLKVLDAIIQKDAVQAENAARQHVKNVFSRIINAASMSETGQKLS
jgi:DNA-binding GntR family transcriptional regulator